MLDQGPFDKAIAESTEAIRLDPKTAYAYKNRGSAYIGKREYDKAITDCTEAIRLDPKSAKAYAARAEAYTKKSDYNRAIADCIQVIALGQIGLEGHLEEPHEVRAVAEAHAALVLANVQWRLEHKDLARRWFDKAVAWMDRNKTEAEGLRQFQDEVAKLLGVPGNPIPLKPEKSKTQDLRQKSKI